MARYWVGSSGSWNDTAHWSTSSGGSGGSDVPILTDDVIIDSLSGLSGGTITINTDHKYMHDFTSITGSNYSINCNIDAINFIMYGSAQFESGISFTNFSNTIRFYGDEPGRTIKSNGCIFPGIYINGNSPGDLKLLDNLTITSTVVPLT